MTITEQTIDVSDLPPHVEDHRSPIWWGKFRWDEKSKAAIVCTTLSMHLLHLITGTAENFIMILWALARGLDTKHERDVRVGAVYWYWIAGIWIPLYAIIYFGPRIL